MGYSKDLKNSEKMVSNDVKCLRCEEEALKVSHDGSAYSQDCSHTDMDFRRDDELKG